MTQPPATQPPATLTQRQAAEALIANVKAWSVDETWQALDLVVGKAGNTPPEGESDGTVPEALWYALRDVNEALWKLRAAMTVYDTAIADIPY